MRQFLMILILLGPLPAAFAAYAMTGGVGAGGLPRQAALETEATPGFFRCRTPLTFRPGDDLPDEQKTFLC